MDVWKDYFSDIILQRGYNYYSYGEFDNICRINNTVYALVYGTETYNVKIVLDENDNIIDMVCDCPYGDNCKHMACICYYLENNEIKKIKPSENLNLSVKMKM